MKTSKYFVVATLFATLSLGLLSCEDDDKLVYITMPTSGTEKGYEDGIWYNFDSDSKTASVTYKGIYHSSDTNAYTGSVVIPSTVTYEGEEYSVTEIEDCAFRLCSSLISVSIPSSVTMIGECAFSGCSSLRSVTIPKSVKEIGAWAFNDCSRLTNITIPILGRVSSIGVSTFSGCHSLKSVMIPEGVTTIGKRAFYYCSLTSVTIPRNVMTIGDDAFYGCDALIIITCKNTTPPEVGYRTFEYVDKSILLYVPAESVEAYKNAEGWKEFTNIRAIP